MLAERLPAMIGLLSHAALDAPPCPRRIVVDTSIQVDTGGPEALVQLAVALASLCGNRTYRWKSRIPPRLQQDYPQIRVPPEWSANPQLSGSFACEHAQEALHRRDATRSVGMPPSLVSWHPVYSPMAGRLHLLPRRRYESSSRASCLEETS